MAEDSSSSLSTDSGDIRKRSIKEYRRNLLTSTYDPTEATNALDVKTAPGGGGTTWDAVEKDAKEGNQWLTKKESASGTGGAASATTDSSGAITPEYRVRRRNAIAAIESHGNYAQLGPITRTGDRAYGKYGIMGDNIPQWTKETLGRSMTPQEFLADSKAQDAVFDDKFGYYESVYGPKDAASMWFTGRPLNKGGAAARDQLGTSGQGYADQYVENLKGGGGGGASNTGTGSSAGGDGATGPSLQMQAFGEAAKESAPQQNMFEKLATLDMMKKLMPHMAFTPISYDPFAYLPKVPPT